MNRISSLFLVSLFSGVLTLSAYKLLFDNNGYFSSNKNSVVTLAPNSYGKQVGLSAENVDFTEAAEKAITQASLLNKQIPDNVHRAKADVILIKEIFQKLNLSLKDILSMRN